jgi:hypothetical protein
MIPLPKTQTMKDLYNLSVDAQAAFNVGMQVANENNKGTPEVAEALGYVIQRLNGAILSSQNLLKDFQQGQNA